MVSPSKATLLQNKTWYQKLAFLAMISLDNIRDKYQAYDYLLLKYLEPLEFVNNSLLKMTNLKEFNAFITKYGMQYNGNIHDLRLTKTDDRKSNKKFFVVTITVKNKNNQTITDKHTFFNEEKAKEFKAHFKKCLTSVNVDQNNVASHEFYFMCGKISREWNIELFENDKLKLNGLTFTFERSVANNSNEINLGYHNNDQLSMFSSLVRFISTGSTSRITSSSTNVLLDKFAEKFIASSGECLQEKDAQEILESIKQLASHYEKEGLKFDDKGYKLCLETLKTIKLPVFPSRGKINAATAMFALCLTGAYFSLLLAVPNITPIANFIKSMPKAEQYSAVGKFLKSGLDFALQLGGKRTLLAASAFSLATPFTLAYIGNEKLNYLDENAKAWKEFVDAYKSTISQSKEK